MFTTFLEIDGYRAFRRLRIDDLQRVNLFVGTNNSGKTCLLEAVEWAASDRVDAVFKGLVRRGLVRVDPKRVGVAREGNTPFVDSLFHRGGTESAAVRWSNGRCVASRQHGEEAVASRIRDGILVTREPGPGEVFPVVDGTTSIRGWIDGHDLDDDRGAIFVGLPQTQDLEIDILWERIGLTWAEEFVLEAVRLLVPDAERIAVLGGEPVVRTPAGRRRLAEYGEGTLRIAALVMAVAGARKVALLDEVDTGLHYSVLPMMLEMLVATAISASNQVFATTHSGDCLRAIARLARDAPSVASEIAIHRLEPDRVVRLSADDVATALEHDVEVRGIA